MALRDRTAEQGAGDSEDGDAALEAIMWHPTWRTAGGSADEGTSLAIHRIGERRILEIFSDLDAIHDVERRGDVAPSNTVAFGGFELFEALEGVAIDRVSIDPASDHTVYYVGEQVDLMRAWARQIAVEAALHVPDRLSNPFAKLANYDRYSIVLVPTAQATVFMLAPDDGGRDLAALFTRESYAEEFIASLGDAAAGAFTQTITGIELFDRLKEMQLDGMVFNAHCSADARALSIAVLERLLPDVLSS